MNPQISPVQLPPFYLPMPSMVHPFTAIAQEKSAHFITRFRLYPNEEQRNRLIAGNCGGGLAGCFAPVGKEELLQVAADFSMWAFAFDDDYCDEGPTRRQPIELAVATASMMRAAEAPEFIIDETANYPLALRDIVLRMGEHTGKEHVERFVQGLKGWFYVEVLKAGYAARNIIPNLSDYTYIRLYSGGTMAFVTLPYIIEELDMPAWLMEDRRIRALTEIAALVADWDTEIYSYPKELHRTSDGFNIVDAIQHAYHYNVEQALITSMAFRDRAFCRFLRLRDIVLEDKTLQSHIPLLERYFTGLCQYIRGINDWCTGTLRYTSLDGMGVMPAIQQNGYSNTPSDVSEEPLPIGCIAWWWHV
ncbi:hypothetical protein GFS24_06610 [Chitinophaga sp. SYP-B3965]|uniref:terpene synthase family protein n=1 Tax=Chitinophaga sp. SYP-B3965 TaxID=2663120 RepID=UPI001299BFF0|nr:hypothetical protein [Chitinophaga sp. SYP-B3965]MRG44777.1 hypothetical protein [Chitinophaga sp. SYP-B3965]